jgi:hypothetical protein
MAPSFFRAATNRNLLLHPPSTSAAAGCVRRKPLRRDPERKKMDGAAQRRATLWRPDIFSALWVEGACGALRGSAPRKPTRVCAHITCVKGSLPGGLRPVTHSSTVWKSPLPFTAAE